ncbi:MAG: hypothetical protein OEL81_02600 [Nitrosopumilus sp.]|nr:hypothetical protein [Nitrosopumilus sp.]
MRKVVFQSFEEARKFAQTLKISNQTDWRINVKSGKFPDDIPRDPPSVYKKDWKGWGDWLRAGKKPERESTFLTFEEAREFSNLLNLKNNKEWRKYCSSGIKPENIPSNPESVYKTKGWKGFGDWLGTGIGSKLSFLPFEESRKYVHTLQLSGKEEWVKYCKSNKRLLEIPASPDRTFKKVWKGWGDWLGTGIIANKNLEFLPFDEAREFVHSLDLKNQKEWSQYVKSGNKPTNIPSTPTNTYKDQWKGLGDWLGTGRKANKNLEFLPFDEAREFVNSLKLKGQSDWNTFCKSGNKSDNIPTAPNSTYNKKGWTNWGDWLGTGIIATKDREYLPFNEAREFVQGLKLKSDPEWRIYRKSGELPPNIPSNPNRTYKNHGWKNMGDWLGTGIIATKDREYMKFDEARQLVRELAKKYKIKNLRDWIEFSKSENRPKGIPSAPWWVYRKKHTKIKKLA